MSTDSKLLAHVDALLLALEEVGPRSNVYKELRVARVPEIDAANLDAQALGHWAAQMRGAFDDAFGDTFTRVMGHQDAILALSNDDALTAPVRRAAQIASRVQSTVDDLVQDIEYARNFQDMAALLLRMFGAMVSAAPNGPELKQAVAQIETYRRNLRNSESG